MKNKKAAGMEFFPAEDKTSAINKKMFDYLENMHLGFFVSIIGGLLLLYESLSIINFAVYSYPLLVLGIAILASSFFMKESNHHVFMGGILVFIFSFVAFVFFEPVGISASFIGMLGALLTLLKI